MLWSIDSLFIFLKDQQS